MEQNNADRALALITQSEQMMAQITNDMYLIGTEVKEGRMKPSDFFGALGFLNHSIEQVGQTLRLLRQVAKNAARDYHHMSTSLDDVEAYITQQVEAAKDELLLNQFVAGSIYDEDVDEWASRILEGEGEMVLKEAISQVRQTFRRAEELAQEAQAMRE